MRLSSVVAAGVLAFGAIVSYSNAQTLHWDIDTIDQAGAGGAAPAGTWDTGTTPNWNVNSDGTGVPGLWTANADAVFSAGSDGTGTATVTLTTPVNANSVTVEEGTIQFATGILTLTGAGGIFNVATGASASFAGTPTLAGTVGVTKNGGGTLFLAGSEAYSTASGPQLTINEGVADFTGDTALGAVPGAARANAVVINGGTLRFSGSSALTLNVNRGVTIGANGGTIEVVNTSNTGLSLPASATFTLNGSGTLTKTGAGRFTLNTTSNSFTGKYIVKGGTINVPGDGRFGLVPASPVADYFRLDGGALRSAITTASTWNANRGITLLAGGGTLYQPGAGTTTDSLTYNGIIAGTAGGGLTIGSTGPEGGGSSDGIVILGGANTYDGSTTINPGMTLRIGTNANVIPDASNVTVNGTLDLNGFDETVGVVIVNNSAATIIPGTLTPTLTATAYDLRNSGTISAILGGAGAATKTTANVVSLSGANTFTGGFNLNAGTVRVNSTTALGAANSAVNIANGTTLSTTAGTGRILTYAFAIGGNFTLGQVMGGTAAVTMAGTMDLGGATRTITIANAADTISAVISNGGLIVNAGTGALTLTGANTYTGNTTINSGTVQLNGTSTLGDNVPATAGTLNFAGGNLRTSATRTASSAPISNPVNVAADALITTTSTNAAVDLNFSNDTIGGSGKITFRNDAASGTGVFQPRFTGSGANFTPGPIEIENGAFGTTVLQSYNSTGTTQTFSNVLSGTGGYIRNASTAGTGGTTIFTAANTYSGNTSVSRGTLLVNNANLSDSGTGSGNITVGGNGKLGGSGSIQGLITVDNFGVTAPGGDGVSDTIATLTAKGGMTLNGGVAMGDPGAVLNFDLAAPGTSDLINVTLNDGLTINGGAVNLFDAGGLAAGTYTLIDYVGTLGGAFGNLALGMSQPAGFTFQLIDNMSNTSIDLQVAVGTPGDYNSDGKVDAADYVVWRKNPGGFPVDAYDVWRQNFGNPPGSGSSLGGDGGAVPEPAAFTLLLTGALAMCSRRRRS